MKKTITIIRHAESRVNAGLCRESGEFTNCRITDNGKEQATKLSYSFDVLILSPLKRVLETYTNSKIKTGDILISHFFRETKEDHTTTNFLENEKHSYETVEEIKLRALNARIFIENIKSNNIGIISHCGFIYHFLIACGQNPKYLENTESITFDI